MSFRPLAKRDMPAWSRAQNFLNGKAVEGHGPELDVTFPVTGETMVTIATADEHQVDEAVAAARQSFDHGPWRRASAAERAEVLNRTADLLEAQQEELVKRILFDNAKTRDEARIDVFAAVGSCRVNAQCALDDQAFVPPPERGVERRVVREPVGVVAGLTPFNAPLMFTGLKAAPPLASGNSVVLKPSERSPLLAIAFCEAATAAGVPDGVLNLVHGPAETAAQICRHPDVDMITITGGNRAGTAVMQAAAPTVKNLLLELGGKSAHIVLADADLDQAIPAVAAGIFRNAGQRCFSGSRLVVEESIADRMEQEVAEIAENLILGDPFDQSTQIGPLIDQQAVLTVEKFVARAVEDGLRIGAGGGRAYDQGSFFRPTLLLGGKADSFAAQEEIFGPVLTVIRVQDTAEAVRVANRSRFGLAGGVWSRDLGKAQHVAAAVRTGYLWINTYGAVFNDVPFGGYGQSGMGREAGRYGYEPYTEYKTIMRDTTSGTSAPLFDTPLFE